MRQAAQDDLNVAVAGVDLAAFDDADFRELILQCSRHGVRSLETSTRLVSDMAASLISMVAAMVTAGWLAPVLTLAAGADAWAAMRVAKRINLRIRRGEVIVLVGQNGSGKTTLGKLITGLYQPTDGTVTWDGVDIALADPRRLHTAVSVISQEPARSPMTAGRNIRVGRLDSDDPERWRAVAANQRRQGHLPGRRGAGGRRTDSGSGRES